MLASFVMALQTVRFHHRADRTAARPLCRQSDGVGSDLRLDCTIASQLNGFAS